MVKYLQYEQDMVPDFLKFLKDETGKKNFTGISDLMTEWTSDHAGPSLNCLYFQVQHTFRSTEARYVTCTLYCELTTQYCTVYYVLSLMCHFK